MKAITLERPNPVASLPRGSDQLERVCARGRNDKVSRALCGGAEINSLLALQGALGLSFTSRDPGVLSAQDANFALLGHSTSLVGLDVSAINPRAFVFTPLLQRVNGYVVVAFTRGSTFVELAAQDSATSPLTFYLLDFDIACEATRSCTNADLLTSAIERDWRAVSLYDDEDLKNTTVDCLHCHQPNGPDSPRMLRMQEFQLPWTHWFSDSLDGGIALLQDFQGAHADEDYAGIPGALIAATSSGFDFSTFLAGQNFAVQPNEFPSFAIQIEVNASAERQPIVNIPVGTSATWQQIYAASAAGRFIPVPYHDVKVTDPAKLARATTSYRDLASGKIGPEELVDIRDVFLEEALPKMSFVPANHASGREILVQACSQCHNPRLDQTLSRARFDATRLDQMSPEVKALALERMLLPANDIRRMPPVMFRSLPDNLLQRAIDALN